MEENRQALFERLDTDVKTNIGRIPAPDYLEMRAGEYGYDSYEEMYEEGYRIAGYEKISPKVIEEWQRQKEQARPSLKERLARELENVPLDSGNQKKLQAHKGCNAALYSRQKKHFIFDSINTITEHSFR